MFFGRAEPKALKYVDCISSEEITEEFASSIMNVCLELIVQVLELWKNLPSISEVVFRLKYDFLPKLKADSNWHHTLATKLQNVQEMITNITTDMKKRSHIIPKRKKEIKMLRLYDPELDEK